MDGEHIGPAEQFVLGDVRGPGLFGGSRRQVSAPRDDVHAEGGADPCHPGADAAQAEHAEHRAAELTANRGLPSAGTHGQRLVHDVACGGKDERPSQLDRGLEVAAGGAHIDAALLGGRDVDGGVERPGGSDHLEPRQPLDGTAGQRCPLAHDAHHVERFQSLDDGVRIGEMVVEDADLGPGRDR